MSGLSDARSALFGVANELVSSRLDRVGRQRRRQWADRIYKALEEIPADLPVATGDAGTESECPERRPWRPEDGDTRCQECGHEYRPWFTDNPLWNEVMGGSAYEGDPGGYLCPRCFTVRAERTFPGLIWRVIPQWNGRAEPMDWPIADAAFATSAAGSSLEDAGAIETLIERSSLGTPEAAALRATVSDERAAKIVARAKELEDAGERVALSEAEAKEVLTALRRALAVEQEAAALREQVAAASALRDEWDDPALQLQRLPLTRSDVVDQLASALADPASVLAQRDAEVRARALDGLTSDLAVLCDRWDALTKGPSPTTLAVRAAIERARGPRQGVDRG